MLPNPDMNFTSFDILTAEEMNELVANIESISDATGIEDGVILTRHLGQSVVTSDKIDYATLKVWIPDYANQQATNRWASSATWTNNQGRGFILAWLYSYNVGSVQQPIIRINGKQVNQAVMEAQTTSSARVTGNSTLLPVANGDVISYTNANSLNSRELYFIPGRWV